MQVAFGYIEKVFLKRIPAQPREAHTVSFKDNEPQEIHAVPYETLL